MDGHQGPQGLNRIPPTDRLTVNLPIEGTLIQNDHRYMGESSTGVRWSQAS